MYSRHARHQHHQNGRSSVVLCAGRRRGRSGVIVAVAVAAVAPAPGYGGRSGGLVATIAAHTIL